jgi:NAD(P)-dependent dehydrogenase (short-subunit alcohol dehydrogenase family)
MGKILVIGATGLIGAEVVKVLGAENCLRASRSSNEKVDISDPASLQALFGRVGEVDGIICTGGAARFKPWDQQTDEDWMFSLANKLLGQVNHASRSWRATASTPATERPEPEVIARTNAAKIGDKPGRPGSPGAPGRPHVVRYGAKNVRPAGAITLTTGLAAQYPSPGSAIITTVNSAVEAFVRAAAVEPQIAVRVNAVSPGWVAETLPAMGRDPAGGISAADVAKTMVRQSREGASGSVAPAAKG